MINDANGAQKNEVYWMLEKVRRAIHLVYISSNKNNDKELDGAIDQIFKYIMSIVRAATSSDPIKRTGAELAANELRGVVEREISERRRKA